MFPNQNKAKSMNIIQYGWEWLCRFRNRCGYGIHSPFAFNFVTRVVFERGTYYAYQSLDATYHQGLFWRMSHRRKSLHFLLRLANFVRPEFIINCHSLGLPEKAYLQSGARHAIWVDASVLNSVLQHRVLVCCDAEESALKQILAAVHTHCLPGSALLVSVRNSEERARCVTLLQQSPDCAVTFDLYNYLLAFFDFDLYKQHYRINFLD